MLSKEKIILFILAAIQFTHIMDFMIVMPLGPTLMRLFEITPKQYGMVVSGYAIAAGVFGFLGAFFIDRYDRRNALITCYILFIIGTFACALSMNFCMLLIARMFTGAFGGLLISVLISMVADIFAYERRAAAMGTVMMAFSLAAVVGVPFGLYLSNSFSWEAPFILLGCISLILLIPMIKYIPSITQHIRADSNPWKDMVNVKEIIVDANHIKALVVMFLLMIGQFTVIPFISAYMVSNTGFLESDLSYIYLFGGGASMLTMPIIGKLSDKYGKIRIFTILIFLSVIPIYMLTNMDKVPFWLAVANTTVFFVIIGGRGIPATTMISAAAVPGKRGSFLSLNTAVRQLSIGGASFLTGHMLLLSESGKILNYDIVGWVAIISSLAALYIARGLKVRS